MRGPAKTVLLAAVEAGERTSPGRKHHQLVTATRTWCGRSWSSVDLAEAHTEPDCRQCLKAIKADRDAALEARRKFLIR